MSSELYETCMFFVDDSNMWIEAQKVAASGDSSMPNMPKLLDNDRDPRCRIDLGALVVAIGRGRRMGDSFLYGSRPPPNDSVWDAAKERNFEVQIFDRDGVRGKEKEVDNAMAADMGSQAAELAVRAEYDPKAKLRKENTTFVVITGDRDMCPPVMKALRRDIRVEVWAWKAGISSKYIQLKLSDGLTVRLLNEIFHEITYTNFRSTRQSNKVDTARTMVLCGFPTPTSDGDSFETWVCQVLLQWGYLFYITWSQPKKALFVEFPKTRDIELMIIKGREFTSFEGVLKVLSWPEYAQENRLNKEVPPAIAKTSNMFMPLRGDHDASTPSPTTVERREAAKGNKGKAKLPSTTQLEVGQGEEEDVQLSTGSDGDDVWETVAPRHDPAKAHRRAIRNSQRCPDGIRCAKLGGGKQSSVIEMDVAVGRDVRLPTGTENCGAYGAATEATVRRGANLEGRTLRAACD